MKHYTRNSDGKYVGVVYRYYVKSDCEESGFSYVGTTTNETIRKQCWNKSNNPYAGGKIAEARKRLGLSSFEYEALESIDSENIEELKSLLKEKETEYIKKYDSTIKGYNSSKGGTGNTGIAYDAARRKSCGNAMRGKHHSEEAKRKISAANTGRTVSEDTRKKISAAHKGKKKTEAQKAAMSASRKGVIPKAACAGAAKWRETHDPYWKGKKIPEIGRQHMKEAQQKRGRKVKAILPTGEAIVYNTMLDAAKAFGINVGSVLNSAKNNGTTKNNLKFRFI